MKLPDPAPERYRGFVIAYQFKWWYAYPEGSKKHTAQALEYETLKRLIDRKHGDVPPPKKKPEPVAKTETPKPGDKLCACGCGEKVNPKSTYRMGHNARKPKNG